MMTVLWSAMPSIINPGLFVKTNSRVLLTFPCLRVCSLWRGTFLDMAGRRLV